MKTQSKIILEVPTIDLVECRKFKGGYYEYWGGVLDPAICEADGPGDNYPDADDGWLPDYDFVNPEDYKEWEDDAPQYDEDVQHDGYDDRDNDGNNDGDNSDDNTTRDTPLTSELASQILQGTGMDFVFDQGYLDKKSGNQKANGTVIFEGQTLPNGEIAETDTIVLGNDATVGTLWEEMFHSWQADNLYTGDCSPNEATSAMEFMNETFECIFGAFNDNVLWGDASDEVLLPNDWLTLIYDCFDLNYTTFDWDKFIDNWNDKYFDEWKEIHANDPYGKGDDTNWDWDWEDAKEWWDEYYGW